MVKAKVDPKLLAWTDEVTLRVLDETRLTPQRLRGASHDELLTLQGQLLLGTEWGIWEVAANLIADHDILPSRHMFRIEHALPRDMDPNCEEARAAWGELIRYCVARRSFPMGGKGTAGRPWFSTLHTEIRSLALVTKHIAERPRPGFWARCTSDEVLDWIGNNAQVRINTLRKLHALGAISDSPQGRVKPKGKGPARHRNHEPEHVGKPQSDAQYLPLPDAFTALAGQRALYLTEHVGPTLLDALEHCADVPVRSFNSRHSGSNDQSLGWNQQHKVRAATLDPIIANWPWRDAEKKPLSELRFEIAFSHPGVGEFSWPPRTHVQAIYVLTVLQGSHLFLTSLADGGRHGEILSLREGSLGRTETATPTLTTRTRKLDLPGGRDHEVPLPSSVQFAVSQQERLARYLKSSCGVTGQHLWVSPNQNRGQPLKSFAPTLRAVVRAFRLQGELDFTNFHMHRFRKTLARICALSLVHAPKILMDVFGHRDEQMTVMRYILSDPGLRQDVQEITRELLVLKGVWAVENLDSLEGKGAQKLRERWAQHAKLIGRSAVEPQHIREFIEVVFENGQALAVIAPGIMCTNFTKGGRCNEYGGGQPNPEHCDPHCEHQIASATFADPDSFDVVDVISNAMNTADYLLEQLSAAEDQEDGMLISTFAGQVRSLMGRWKAVDAHVTNHPVGKRYIPLGLASS